MGLYIGAYSNIGNEIILKREIGETVQKDTGRDGADY